MGFVFCPRLGSRPRAFLASFAALTDFVAEDAVFARVFSEAVAAVAAMGAATGSSSMPKTSDKSPAAITFSAVVPRVRASMSPAWLKDPSRDA
jgi:translation elongation factor EF-Ts